MSEGIINHAGKEASPFHVEPASNTENSFKQANKHKWEEALKADSNLDEFRDVDRSVRPVSVKSYLLKEGSSEFPVEGVTAEPKIHSKVSPFIPADTLIALNQAVTFKQGKGLYSEASAVPGVNGSSNPVSGSKTASDEVPQKVVKAPNTQPYQDINIRSSINNDALHIYIRDFSKRYIKDVDTYLKGVLENAAKSGIKLEKVFFNTKELDLSKNIIKQLEVL